ncbi:MAG: ribosomal protein S18-alanine N-acetyltransferase [Clostridia bacterium]|nr:ribosomal protein S18-alanine N-acetyltransferase [Clostridia bacterium]
MMGEVTVRPAAAEDVSALAALEKECFPDPWGETAVAGQLSASYGLSLVAERDGIAVGYLFLAVLPPEGDVNRIAVSPAARRAGVGDALLRAGLAAAAERGVSRIFLDVRESNLPAISLYRKHGFAETGRRKDYYRAPRENAVLMERENDAIPRN